MELRCKYCGSLNLETEKKGTQTGVYCCDCGKWLKWATKEEIRLINHKDEYIVKKNPTLIDIKVIEDIKAEIKSICENTTYFRIVADEDYFLGLEYAIKIIDKHIGTENEIHVGDEVVSDSFDEKGIVTHITDKNCVSLICGMSSMINTSLDKIHKTGKSYPQIVEILEQLKGDKE